MAKTRSPTTRSRTHLPASPSKKYTDPGQPPLRFTCRNGQALPAPRTTRAYCLPFLTRAGPSAEAVKSAVASVVSPAGGLTTLATRASARRRAVGRPLRSVVWIETQKSSVPSAPASVNHTVARTSRPPRLARNVWATYCRW